MREYYRRELDGHLVWSDFDMEAAQHIAEKYTRISRAKWREYKRAQRRAYDEMNHSDSDGRPFKDAGR